MDEQAFRPQWQFKFQAHFDKWFGLPQCLKTYHLSLYNIKKDILLKGLLAMLYMPSFDLHLPPCTEGFLIHLSPLRQLPLWQLPLFPSVAQFPCVRKRHQRLGEISMIFTCTILEIRKMFTRKLCDAHIYNNRMLFETRASIAIAQAYAVRTGLRQASRAYCITEFSWNQLRWYPGWSAGKDNPDFAQPLVAFRYSNIWY